MRPAGRQRPGGRPGRERVAAELRAALPPPPHELDARVLASVAREAVAGDRRSAAQQRRRALGGHRARVLGLRSLLAVLAAVAGFAAVALLAPGALFDSGSARAVPILPLTTACPPDVATSSGGRSRRPLVVAGVWSGAEAQSFAAVLRRFERRSGTPVRFEYETRLIAGKLQARLHHGCPPDVAILPQPGLMADLARHHEIRPLDHVAGALVDRHYAPAWRQLGTVGRHLYGVWFKAADKSTVWYSARAFAAAGIASPPATWSALLADARRLARSGVRPFTVAGADGWTLTDWFENVYLRTAGPARYDALAAHRIPWTDPSVAAALRRLADLFADPRLVGARSALLDTTFEDSVAQVFGPQPSAAMVFEGDFVRSFLPHAATDDARFFDVPAIGADRAADAGGGGGGGARREGGSAETAGSGTAAGDDAPGATAVVGGDVAVLFSHAPAAKAFMRFLATPAAAEPWAKAGGFLSPNAGLDPNVYPDALTRRLATKLLDADTIRFDLSDLQPPSFGAVASQGMWQILQDFLAHPTAIARTTHRLEAAATAAWACERAVGGDC